MTDEQKGKIISCFCNGVEFKESTGIPDEYEALAEVLSDALDRQMPYRCGSIIGKCKCGKSVYPHMKYCTSCGQALDWSDE